MSIYGGSIYPSSIYPGNIYDVNIYDPQPVYLEQEIEDILAKNEKELREHFDKLVLDIEKDVDDIGKKSFLLGTALAMEFATKEDASKHDFFKRAIIHDFEKDDYEDIRTKKKLPAQIIEPKLTSSRRQQGETDEDFDERVRIKKEIYEKTLKKYNEIESAHAELEEELTDYIEKQKIKIPSSKSYRMAHYTGYNRRISDAFYLMSKLGGIIDARKYEKERDYDQNEFRIKLDNWFKTNFKQYIKDIPSDVTKPSELLTIDKFKEAFDDLQKKAVFSDKELQKLRDSLLESDEQTKNDFKRIAEQGKKYVNPQKVRDLGYYRIDAFSIYNFLHGYALGEQIQFFEGYKDRKKMEQDIDKYLEDKRRESTPEELNMPLGGRQTKNFEEYHMLPTETINSYLLSKKYHKDKDFSMEFGDLRIPGKESKRIFDKEFKHIRKDKQDEILKRGYKKPMITKKPSKFETDYFEFYNPKNPLKKEFDLKSLDQRIDQMLEQVIDQVEKDKKTKSYPIRKRADRKKTSKTIIDEGYHPFEDVDD